MRRVECVVVRAVSLPPPVMAGHYVFGVCVRPGLFLPPHLSGFVPTHSRSASEGQGASNGTFARFAAPSSNFLVAGETAVTM